MSSPPCESPTSPGSPGPGEVLGYFKRLHRDEQAHRVASEFSQLQHLDHVPQPQVDATFATSLAPGFREKNRYSDVLANERTLYPPRSSGRYINANFISREHFDVSHNFVACQAPLPAYMEEFWDVLASSKTPLVINLTGLVEGGRVKSQRYWPTGGVGASVKYGKATVTIVKEERAGESEVAESTVRVLKHEPSGHEVTQVHFEGWPDMGVPRDSRGVRSIIDFIERTSNPAEAPVFVHCSAGIGRTGTLIGAYTARQMLRAGDFAEDAVVSIVSVLKSARCGMVQRREQFAFIYGCALDDAGAELPELPQTAPQRKSARVEETA